MTYTLLKDLPDFPKGTKFYHIVHWMFEQNDRAYAVGHRWLRDLLRTYKDDSTWFEKDPEVIRFEPLSVLK